MIANATTILIGLWLVYRAIFSVPAGNVGQVEVIVAGAAVVLLALWARRTDLMSWHSVTNIMLGLIILLLGLARWSLGLTPPVAFWIVLLIGNAVAVIAMWSLLYRPAVAQAAAPS